LQRRILQGIPIQSKYRGTEMIYQAAVNQGLIENNKTIQVLTFPTQKLVFDVASVDWRDVVLKVYDPRVTTEIMKQTIMENDAAPTFDLLMKNFTDRPEFAYVQYENINWSSKTDKKITESFGFASAKA
jgi:hypothetical protein